MRFHFAQETHFRRCHGKVIIPSEHVEMYKTYGYANVLLADLSKTRCSNCMMVIFLLNFLTVSATFRMF